MLLLLLFAVDAAAAVAVVNADLSNLESLSHHRPHDAVSVVAAACFLLLLLLLLLLLMMLFACFVVADVAVAAAASTQEATTEVLQIGKSMVSFNKISYQ